MARARAAWLSLVVCACATAPLRDDPTAEQPIIDAVILEGASQLDADEVRSRILSTASSALPDWVPFSSGTQRFDSTAWQADLRRIERYYQAHGYYDARVLEDEVDTSVPGHVTLRVRVHEGSPTRIALIELSGLEAIEPEHQAAVKAALPFAVGKVFLEEDWARVKEELKGLLREQGYAEAMVAGEVQVDTAAQQARVRLELRAGQRYRFVDTPEHPGFFVVPHPGAQVPHEWIKERARSVLKSGDVYRESALSDIQGRIFQMGVFGAVKVTRGAVDRQSGTVPIQINATEAPFRSIRPGVGLGIDQVRTELPRGFIEYTHRNFYGGLRKLTLRGKGAYAFLPNPFAVAQDLRGARHGLTGNLLGELQQPRFLLQPNLTAHVSVEALRGLEAAYDYSGVAPKAGVVWSPRPRLNVFPSLNANFYWLSSQIDLGSPVGERFFGCPNQCFLGYAELTVEYDGRDRPADARRGYYLALSTQLGWRPPWGEVDSFWYLRAGPDLRGYVSLGADDQLTLAAKLRFGTLVTFPQTATSPIIARYFSGGSSSMRGFGTRRLSPLVAVPTEKDKDGLAVPAGSLQGETLPVGGNGLIEGSLEGRYALWGDLSVAAFLDAGLVSAEALRLDAAVLQGNLHLALGTGLRYRLPVGTVRLDVARRVAGPALDVREASSRTVLYPQHGRCFGIPLPSGSYPGRPEDICSFHLSIGEAF